MPMTTVHERQSSWPSSAQADAAQEDILANAGSDRREPCATTPWWCPTRPTAPPSRKSMRWSCARATASASCSKKIEQSIARIDAGDYGYCETCEPIGVPRLLDADRHAVAGGATATRAQAERCSATDPRRDDGHAMSVLNVPPGAGGRRRGPIHTGPATAVPTPAPRPEFDDQGMH